MTRKQWIALAVVLGCIAVTAVALVRIGTSQRLGQPGLRVTNEPTYDTNRVVVRTQSVGLPETLPNYSSTPVEVSPLEATWLPKDTLFGRKQYSAGDGFSALTSVVLMGTDRTSIHKPQFCLDGQGWKIDKTETTVIPMTRPHPYELRVLKLTTSKVMLDKFGKAALVRGLYVYWFVEDKLLTPYHGERMWWMAKELIRTGVLQRWAYVTYFTLCMPGQEDATFHRLKELIVESVPEFQLAAGPRSGMGSTAGAYPKTSEE